MINKEVKHIDITNTPELIRLAEEVQRSNQVTVLTKDGKEVLEVRPAKPTGKKRARDKVFSTHDPLYNLVGSATSDEPTDAAKKHEYLAQAHGV